jgi:hypothetical protein
MGNIPNINNRIKNISRNYSSILNNLGQLVKAVLKCLKSKFISSFSGCPPENRLYQLKSPVRAH